ncbi:L-histidine N-alpha-methyltransferase [Flavobacterium sp. PL11]|jgi:L-histidine N-alpha-methyltransferase|uniref:L-histidine N(alpha)-methyltransferase n=1 Tax=Flavobacterium sp. PL11 TaxID=3071717 RepID=UPI002E049414|nr:L-histidine N-alpha-methyltransferase [Flavobacterium sp. PL11]
MTEIKTIKKIEHINTAVDYFKNEIDEGLSSIKKSLPSKYFYDKKGDALFVKIMHLPEYYVTRSEHEIFRTKSQSIIEALHLNPNTYFELIELGAGDGLKTKELLRELNRLHYKFDYMPVDISKNALESLEKDLNKEMPSLSIKTKQGDYFEVLESLNENHNSKVILFLGSNIGNMSDDVATDFMSKLSANLQNKDKLLLGVDLIKPASIVLPAYNDSQGITAAFNLNLLQRINKELGANFDLKFFKHQAEYKESDGIAKSFLVSTKAQQVYITKINKNFSFHEGEKILTEISRKYNDEILNSILSKTDFIIKNRITDSKVYFANYILERK